MTPSETASVVRVTRSFDAPAERVYDAFLNPALARRFLFATATGEIIRCDIDARVGGTFTIVDRRFGDDVSHTGAYVELDRPRRIAFTLQVEKYSTDVTTVTIDIAPDGDRCDLTLTHDMTTVDARSNEGAREGWAGILDMAAAVLAEEPPTCGAGVAQRAAIPATIGKMFDALAETLELHRQMLRLDDANARREDEVYSDLARRWSRIARQVQVAAAQMAAQRDLPMGAHHESAWGDAHHRAFAKFVTSQSHLLALLRVAAERDERMLTSMTARA